MQTRQPFNLNGCNTGLLHIFVNALFWLFYVFITAKYVTIKHVNWTDVLQEKFLNFLKSLTQQLRHFSSYIITQPHANIVKKLDGSSKVLIL